MARHLRRKQTADGGGWPLFENGAFDLSASVKAYFALKLCGEPVDAPHMVRSRQTILAAGGITGVNVFTRIQLALFDILPWRMVPAMPVELMLLPKTAWFSIWSVSYWSRACADVSSTSGKWSLRYWKAQPPGSRSRGGKHDPPVQGYIGNAAVSF